MNFIEVEAIQHEGSCQLRELTWIFVLLPLFIFKLEIPQNWNCSSVQPYLRAMHETE
jgi:hypothetical protein